MTNHPNRSKRFIIAPNGDEYHIHANNGTHRSYDVRLFNRAAGAWVDNFNPIFWTIAEAKRYIKNRIS